MDPLNTITTLKKSNYPFLLKRLSKLPSYMEIIGSMPPDTYKYLCVVGARHYSSYGKEVCEKLITGLAGYPIVIVSGLALGIDSIAHEAALKAKLLTIAFPGSGLDINAIYPQTHVSLARRIVEAGGAVLSPFKRNISGQIWTFPVRNKLMAGISQATLVIEAKEDSGSLITAKDTGIFSRDLLVVPGSIFSITSIGSNNLLRDGGIAVTSSDDILVELGLLEKEIDTGKVKQSSTAINKNLFESFLSSEEKMILEKMSVPIERDELIRQLDFPIGFITAILIELELKGIIIERQGLLMTS